MSVSVINRRVMIHYINFILLMVAWIIIIIPGIILRLVLPSGAGKFTLVRYFLGLSRGEWVTIHTYASIAFNILAPAHLLLSWDWIKNVTKVLLGRRSGSSLSY